MFNRAIDSSYDDEYLTYLPGRTYMAGVSPWFFTHYSEETYNKNLLYRSDDWLYVSRWENLIAYRNVIDLVQIISWNDNGESHYIGPIDGAQPMSESWATGWLDVTQYYATAFKTGVYPAIEKDRVFIWGRLYPAGANAPDGVGKPLNSECTDDYVWGLVFLTSPAHVDLGCGVHHEAVELPAGANKVKLSLLGVDDCVVTTTISRNGRSVLGFRPEQYRFRKNPPTYNFNALVVSSPP
ncbi:hypothetical protein D9613_010543 [Agrocybe pediades]|uniref:Glycoside hydrolase family 71 protein n=1 Tax=Agrocybe pediades TaxID=84607 RepID=A0A8H4VHY5_9AGAR|nr:hypothetical protein D9613_010543 [Agrocybe pediades]